MSNYLSISERLGKIENTHTQNNIFYTISKRKHATFSILLHAFYTISEEKKHNACEYNKTMFS